MRSLAWECESTPQLFIFEQPEKIRNLMLFENRSSQDFITQQSTDGKDSQRQKDISFLTYNEEQLDSHWSEDLVNVSKIDIRLPTSNLTELEDTPNSSLEMKTTHDTKTTASTNSNNSTN